MTFTLIHNSPLVIQFFTHGRRKRAIKYPADYESGQQGAEKGIGKERKRVKDRDRERLNYTCWMTYREKLQVTRETLDYLRFDAVQR